MGKIIEVKNLFKLYRVGDSVVHALNGVNFSINEGEFCAIVGTSGSGKSTLLNMIIKVLGSKNTSSLSLQDTAERFRLAEIYGKAVVWYCRSSGSG